VSRRLNRRAAASRKGFCHPSNVGLAAIMVSYVVMPMIESLCLIGVCVDRMQTWRCLAAPTSQMMFAVILHWAKLPLICGGSGPRRLSGANAFRIVGLALTLVEKFTG